MHSTLADLLGTFGAFLLFPLIVIVPGFLLGHVTNILQFRNRSFSYRLSLALFISLSCCPIVIYTLTKFAGLQLVWGLLGASWLIFFYWLFSGRILSVKDFYNEWQLHGRFILSVFACLLITVVYIVDFEVDGRLIRSLLTYDYVKHTAVTDAISRTGVPPVNPSFYPGEPVTLFYYYFWFMLCSFVDLLGGSFVSARHAVLGSVLWGEVSLILITLTYLKQQGKLLVRGLLPAHYKLGLLFLLVTGLDFIPAYSQYVLGVSNGISHQLVPSIEWWNDQVGAWISAVLWVPHHMGALVCCLFAFLLINDRFSSNQIEDAGDGNRLALAVISILGLASAFGMSIWIAFVAAMTLTTWIILARRMGRVSEIKPLLIIGISTAVILLPYILDLHGAQSLESNPLILTVRPFPILELMRLDISDGAMLLLRFVVLPFNYIIELGFFLLGGLLYIQYRKGFEEKLSREEQFLLVMTLVSVIVCTFVKSNVKFNDLGWRGFMFAQFGLLLVSMPIGFRSLGSKQYGKVILDRSMQVVLVVFIVLGITSNIYESVVLRKFSYAEQDEYGLALRRAYEWIDKSYPGNIIIQHNPEIEIDYFHALYGNRQVAIADTTLGRLYGINDSLFFGFEQPIKDIYYSRLRPDEIVEIASEYEIDLLVVKKTDPVWRNKASWVWAFDPVYQNAYTRVFSLSTLSE
ncbi:MAG: hypothetical protein AB8G77_14395 [Rhodothermales bacterium]